MVCGSDLWFIGSYLKGFRLKYRAYRAKSGLPTGRPLIANLEHQSPVQRDPHVF